MSEICCVSGVSFTSRRVRIIKTVARRGLRLFVISEMSKIIERFSFECRKTKTKVITLANHIGHRQYIEPIKTRSNYMWLTQSAGKCMRARHNWLWFYF